MNEIRNVSEISETSKPKPEGFKNIKPESGMTANEARGFWGKIFDNLEKSSTEKTESVIPEKFYTTSEQRESQLPTQGRWEGTLGESKFISDSKDVNEVLKRFNLDGIEYRSNIPDFTPCAMISAKIDNMTDNLVKNYNQFCKNLIDSGQFSSVDDIRKFKQENNLEFHECSDTKTCQLVPKEIHQTFTHTGGRMECRERDKTINNGGVFDE